MLEKCAVDIAVIPARGGSKRIPRKNTKLFGGKPIIAWSIEAALASGCFDRIIVSTDDDEIADVARVFGAEVPYRRPAELSDDFCPTAPVIAHAVKEAARSAPVRRACCVYATAPFIRPRDLRVGLRALDRTESDFAFSVTRYPYAIQRALRLDARNRVSMFDPKHGETRSQDLEDAYHDAGQFYWGTAQAWISDKPIFSPRSVGIPLPRVRVQDIDTIDDWAQAELMFRALGSSIEV